MPWFTKQSTVCFATENFGCCNASSAVVIRWLYFPVISFYSVHSELFGVTLWLKPLWSGFCSSHSTHSLLTSALILLIKQDVKRLWGEGSHTQSPNWQQMLNHFRLIPIFLFWFGLDDIKKILAITVRIKFWVTHRFLSVTGWRSRESRMLSVAFWFVRFYFYWI